MCAILFNEAKNTGTLQLWSDGEPSRQIPSALTSAQIPDLDPTLVKAVGLQESNLGVAKSKNEQMDILQINNGLSGGTDFDPHMEHYVLEKESYQPLKNLFKEVFLKLPQKGITGKQ